MPPAERRIQRRPLPEAPPGLRPDLPPLLARVYAARAVTGPDDLDYSLARLRPYALLSGIEGAVDLLRTALREDQRVLVVGDFDADGATSSALTVRALRLMGARQVDYLVPNRFEFGYGLTPEIVAVAAGRTPDLIITVDNGISSLEGVEAARAHGISVLVTDHHLPGEQLPAAAAIVNPNQPGDAFPSKHLAGVGVAFYLMVALRAALRDAGWFAERRLPEPNLASLLDLVALGTVADVVPLDHNNRVLIAQGLARIRTGHCCAGISALIQVSGRERERLVSADLGYALGPRLNAAGRLEDMSQGIECLLAENPARALSLAQDLDRLNRERRDVEAEMQTQALAILERMELAGGPSLPVGLCLYDETWHEGVVGILASRIKERVHRPVIGFAPAAGQPGLLKGSARSLPGLHIRDVLDAVATAHPGLISRFGGHAMAAGLSLARGHLPDFRRAFDREVRRRVDDGVLRGVVWTDGALTPRELDLGLAETLRRAGPWGQGFPEPMFDGRFALLHRRIVGGRHLKLWVRPEHGRHPMDAIAFNTIDEGWPAEVAWVHLVYRLDVNRYQGQTSLQLVIEYLDPLAD